jgi:multicomponent Na+:H+ antiporter subunit D
VNSLPAAIFPEFPPGMILVIGALLIPFLKGKAQKAYAVVLPFLSVYQMSTLPEGLVLTWQMFDYTLEPVRVDKLSLVWGWVFHIAALISVIYQLHVKDKVQDVAGIMYAGGAIAAAFAGDLVTLFIFWELTAITSVFLIYARRTNRAATVGTRYMVIQVGSGVILLFGMLLWVHAGNSLAFGHSFDIDNWQQIGMFIDPETRSPVNAGAWLMLIAFGIKAAFPFLHNWLQDSYPEATVTGTVFLSAFTTKLAIYALARGFAGTEILVPIGVVMTLFPIFFAVIENDLRKVLAYSLNNQLGYMVVGIGIGTQLALNGTAAHAFAHIIYKGLLFMSMGAVLYRTGTIKASELGGLYKSMPLTCVFCIIGSLSIAGFPLFSGFISKSMTLTAAFGMGETWIFIGLLIASAGVVDHSGIKIPFFAFFAHDSGKRVEEAPTNMLIAMGIAAFICIFLGVYPQPLYEILPFTYSDLEGNVFVPGKSATEEWHNFTAGHVMTSLQLLLFAALAFTILWRTKLYPPELRSTNLDFDVVYRKVLPRIVVTIGRTANDLFFRVVLGAREGLIAVVNRVGNKHRPNNLLGEPWPSGQTALWAAFALGLFLLLSLR